MRAFNANDYFKFLVVFSLMLLAGCAENAYTVQKGMTDAVETATLREISVTGEGPATKIEIAADRPLTYTSYSDKDPHRLILDISNAEPGAVKTPQLDPSLLVKKIEVTKNELTAGSLVRITMESADDVDYAVNSNPANMATITVVATPKNKPESATTVQAAPAAMTAPVSAPAVQATTQPTSETTPQAAATAKTEPAAPEKTLDTQARTKVTSSTPALTDIAVVSDGIEIRTSGPVKKYKYFNMTKPQRLVVDIFGFKNMIAKTVRLNAFGVDTARLGNYPEKTRIVFDSSAAVFPTYTMEKSDAGLKLNLASSVATVGTPAIAEKTSAAKEQPEPVPVAVKQPSAINAIDFKVIDGVSRIQVTVTGDCDLSTPTRTSDGLMLTFSSCQLPKSLQRPFDTSSFESVVKKMTPYQAGKRGRKDAKIRVTLKQSAPYTVKREGSVILVDITNPPHSAISSKNEAAVSDSTVAGQIEVPVNDRFPSKRATAASRAAMRGDVEKSLDRKTYTGKRVTLEFADADIRKIFQLIAEVSNLNILVGDDVTGTISIKLVNVPWDQALDVILDTKGLAMKRTGNIVVIRPRDKMTTQADEEFAAKKAYEKTLEMRMKIFDVNYADVKEVAAQFNNYKSERGSITTDARTNRVIVNDIGPSIEKMTSLLKELDMPEKQVLIEARIVEATSELTQDIGIAWAAHYDNSPTATLDTGMGGTLTNAIGSTGLAIAPGAAMGLTLGKLAQDFSLDMRLSAAITAGHGRVVSTPKIVTLNNKAAKIIQGFLQPYQTISAEGTKTEFVEAALKLEVTPHITGDGSVSMKIKAAKDTIGAAPAGVAPPINKKEATTEMLVKSGETTVIGGIYQDEDATTDEGVPWLKDIPVLGWLFKSNNTKKNKTELLIFITPKIVE